jgi:hypothetical protein
VPLTVVCALFILWLMYISGPQLRSPWVVQQRNEGGRRWLGDNLNSNDLELGAVSTAPFIPSIGNLIRRYYASRRIRNRETRDSPPRYQTPGRSDSLPPYTPATTPESDIASSYQDISRPPTAYLNRPVSINRNWYRYT